MRHHQWCNYPADTPNRRGPARTKGTDIRRVLFWRIGIKYAPCTQIEERHQTAPQHDHFH